MEPLPPYLPPAQRSSLAPPPPAPGPAPALAPPRPVGPPTGLERRTEPSGLGDHGDHRSWLRRKLSAAGAALIALLAKLKAILLLIPKIKILASAGTMVVSVIAYGSIWGFAFGAGFVALILVHEMGHVIQLRREGVHASVPIFIPFLGAVIGARTLGENALAEARVGLAGPILGSIGSAACIVVWHATGNDLWRALAYTGFLLNLFNLIPVVPLDGGRAMAAMTPWMWVVGFAGLAGLAILDPSPIFVLILIIGAFEIYRRWQRRRHGGAAEAAYYRVAPIDRALVAAVYISLIALLAVGMHAMNLPRTII
jgi:Zn-dependent protease